MNTINLNTIGERPVKKVAGASGGNFVYYSGGIQDFGEPVVFASIIKTTDMLFTSSGYWVMKGAFENIKGAGFDLSIKMSHPDSGEFVTIGEIITKFSKNWTQITEEEFYKMPNQFTFHDGETAKTYYYDESMTWEEWVNSNYNTEGIVIERDYIMFNEGFVSSNDGFVRTYDTIVRGSYFVSYVE